MKLRIVEYKLANLVNICDEYRYALVLGDRLMLRFVSITNLRMPKDYVVNKLMTSIIKLTDHDLEHYNKYNLDKVPGINIKVLFEQEVSDHYLKDLKIQERIKDLERDFTND